MALAHSLRPTAYPVHSDGQRALMVREAPASVPPKPRDVLSVAYPGSAEGRSAETRALRQERKTGDHEPANIGDALSARAVSVVLCSRIRRSVEFKLDGQELHGSLEVLTQPVGELASFDAAGRQIQHDPLLLFKRGADTTPRSS